MLADLVLGIHFLFVIFVVGALPAVWIGAGMRWRWVKNFRFRAVHLGAIIFVTAEAAAGAVCPLTMLEAQLRHEVASRNFIGYWLHRLLFYSFPEWVFITAYSVFLILVLVTWYFVAPTRQK